MPDWRDEVSGAVQAWLGAIPAGTRAPMWKQIGMARPKGRVRSSWTFGVQDSSTSPRTWKHCDSARSDQAKQGATGIVCSKPSYRPRFSRFGSRPTSSSTTFVSGRCDSHPPTSSNRYGTVWRS